MDFPAGLYGYVKQRTHWSALHWRDKAKRETEFSDEGGESEYGDYTRPTTVVWPEQEDVVFHKQMIERCDRLPKEERDMAMLIFDRASAAEMAKELGVSMKDVARRTTAVARRLRSGG